MDATEKQPIPHGIEVDIATMVMRDIEARANVGQAKYGERLHPFNGRCALLDAYQEALDLAMYLRQRLYEEENQQSGHRANQTK